MRIRPVPSEDFPSVLTLLEQAFPDVTRLFFHAISQYDPWYNENFSLAVEVNHKLVSFVQIFDRVMMLNGKSIRFGGIGSVGTHPKHRGKGYATALMNHAHEVMKQDGLAGGLLFTKIHPYYKRLGWQTLNLSEQVIQTSDLKLPVAKEFSYRLLKKSDFETLHNLYENEQKNWSGTVIRNQSYWQKRPFWMSHPCHVLLKNEKIMGYFYTAKYRENVPMLHVIEYGFQSTNEKILHAFFAAIENVAKENFCTSLCANFKVHSTIHHFLHHQNISWTEQPYHYMMWRDATDQHTLETINRKISENKFVYWQTDAF